MHLQEIEQVQLQSKQNNMIRKATAQSLQPVITKVEEHIGYLLEETAKLRQKCEVLQKKTYQHQVINKSMQQIREQIHKIHLKFQENSAMTQTQSIGFKKQIVDLTVQTQRINSDLIKKQIKISDLFEKNTEQANKLEKTSDNLKQIVEQYVKNVTKVQIENRKINKEIQKIQEKQAESWELLEIKNKWRDEKIQQSSQRLVLYLSERKQMNKLIKEMWSKVDKSVDIDRYENDWRIIRIENQEMKKQNKRMVDEALTPEVRAFLPEMLQRISEIRKVNGLEISFNQQKQKTDKFQSKQILQISELKKQLSAAEKRTQAIRQQLKNDDKNNSKEIYGKLLSEIKEKTEQIQRLRRQSTELVNKKQRQIREDIQNFRETFIEKNKTKIYQTVYNLIPEQQKQEYKRLKQFSKVVVPIVENTKKEIMERCDQITKFGLSLEQRLDSFNNRITKIRGDMNLQIENIKKRIKILENTDANFTQNFKNVGKIISSYCELFLLIYSLSFDPNDKEVYITFNDGIILQKSENIQDIYYRKLRANKNQMRRAGLTSLIKIVDSLMQNEEYLFMQVEQNKPSEFFKNIKESIMISKLYQGTMKSQSQRKQRSSIKMRQSQNKLPSIQMSINKTIQLNKQVESEEGNNLLSQTLASDFSNMRKKSKDKQKKGRYNQIK